MKSNTSVSRTSNIPIIQAFEFSATSGQGALSDAILSRTSRSPVIGNFYGSVMAEREHASNISTTHTGGNAFPALQESPTASGSERLEANDSAAYTIGAALTALWARPRLSLRESYRLDSSHRQSASDDNSTDTNLAHDFKSAFTPGTSRYRFETDVSAASLIVDTLRLEACVTPDAYNAGHSSEKAEAPIESMPTVELRVAGGGTNVVLSSRKTTSSIKDTPVVEPWVMPDGSELGLPSDVFASRTGLSSFIKASVARDLLGAEGQAMTYAAHAKIAAAFTPSRSDKSSTAPGASDVIPDASDEEVISPCTPSIYANAGSCVIRDRYLHCKAITGQICSGPITRNSIGLNSQSDEDSPLDLSILSDCSTCDPKSADSTVADAVLHRHMLGVVLADVTAHADTGRETSSCRHDERECIANKGEHFVKIEDLHTYAPDGCVLQCQCGPFGKVGKLLWILRPITVILHMSFAIPAYFLLFLPALLAATIRSILYSKCLVIMHALG